MPRFVPIAVVAALIVVGCGQGAAQPLPTPASVPPSAPTAAASTVTLSASAPTATPSVEPAPTLPPGGTTFKSRVYGYSVLVPTGWDVRAATVPADTPGSTDDMVTDEFSVPGTDTTVGTLAWDLPAGGYDAWVKDFHEQTVAGVPQGCDGGDPSTWPLVPVGTAQGHVDRKCNETVVTLPVGRRVYMFVWGNATFDASHHLPEGVFMVFLAGVTLPDAGTASRPLLRSSPAPSRTPRP